MAILYGTETGNSEEIAKELGDLAERLHFRTIVDEMNNFTLVCLPSTVPRPVLAPRAVLPD
jgi:sulfite reductase alpha subunit-like flavoprotein